MWAHNFVSSRMEVEVVDEYLMQQLFSNTGDSINVSPCIYQFSN